MPYVIFTSNNEEIVRRELKEPVTVGRASECGIKIRDIMMSRTHCRIELQESGWVVIDLGSRNGIFLGNERIERHPLREGEPLSLGRTQMKFCAGPFKPLVQVNKPNRIRPADPHESFAGTVVGFELLQPGEAEYADGFPRPQPQPLEPAAYEQDNVHAMLNDIASSSWDSIQPRATPKTAQTVAASQRPIRRGSRVSFCLQAQPDQQPAEQPPVQRVPRWRRLDELERRVAAALLSVAIILIVVSAFLAFRSTGPNRLSAAEIHPKAAPSSAAQVAASVEVRAVEPPANPFRDRPPDRDTVIRVALFTLLSY